RILIAIVLSLSRPLKRRLSTAANSWSGGSNVLRSLGGRGLAIFSPEAEEQEPGLGADQLIRGRVETPQFRGRTGLAQPLDHEARRSYGVCHRGARAAPHCT